MRPRTIIAIAATVAVVGAFFAWKEYDRRPASTASMRPDITIPAVDLLAAFQADESAANMTYNDKVLEVSGTVKELVLVEDGPPEVVLETGDMLAGVSCSFEAGAEVPWEVGQEARIKGICTGMLMDVVLVRCTPVR